MVSRTEKNKKTITQIEKDNIVEKHKKTLLRLFKILMITIIIIISFFLYARYIGTYGLTIREYSNVYDRLPSDYHGLKIVQISDIHYGNSTFKKELNNMKNKINKLKPDLVFFTGDLIDKDYSTNEADIKNIIDILSQIDVTVGKYAIYGEQDKEVFQNIMEKSNFIILDNRSELIYKNSSIPIYINGINDDIDKAFEKNNNGLFTISIMHEPDKIDKILESNNIDIALAGHSHNGQITIPFIGALTKTKGAKKYSEEYYKMDDTELYISSGIGTSGYPFRLFNHPSINFFRLRSK